MADSDVVVRPLAEVLKDPKKIDKDLEAVVLEVRPKGMLDDIIRLVQLLPSVLNNKRRDVQARKFAQLVEMLSDEPLPVAQLKQAELHANRRREFLKAFPTMTSAQVAELSGSRAKNVAAQASRWKSQEKLFSVTHGGQELYPAFQFLHGQPRDVIAGVMAVNPARGWSLAVWFTSNNGWLPGAVRPVDLLDEDSDAVIEAARQAALPLVG